MAEVLSLFDFAAPIEAANENRIDSAAICARRAVDAFFERVCAGETLSRQLVTSMMTQIYEGTDAAGAWEPKAAYDRLEAAIAKYLLANKQIFRADSTDPHTVLHELEALQRRALIPQARRSQEMERLQQFSTPATISWLAARAARILENDLVLEPSAGTGMLIVHAANMGARCIVNELSEDRRRLLGLIDLPLAIAPLDVDATYLRALYGTRADRPRPSVVLMNPPFSADVNQPDVKIAGLGARHVEQAFHLLRPGGRLVAILGAYDDPLVKTERFAAILEGGALRASIALDGQAYRLFGTTMNVRIIVVDRLPQGATPAVASDAMLSLEDALALIESIAPRATVSGEAIVGHSTLAAVPTVQQIRSTELVAIGMLRNVPCVPVEYSTIEAHDVREVNDNGFQPYEPKRLRFRNAQPHPDPLVESIALRGVLPPVPTYQPLLPPEIVEQGVLSEAQLEAVTYAGQAHEQCLELYVEQHSGEHERKTFRRGYYLGDSGGVGKGRTLFGIVRDNVARGRKRILYITETESLIDSCREYWEKLCGRREEIFPLNRYKPDEKITVKEGILYCTYATMRSASKKTDARRLDQLIAFSPDLIIYDEAHNMAGAASIKSEFGKTMCSQQGRLGLELQEALPDARVVYASATASSEVNELSYAPRLGLWGPGTAFASRTEFVQQMMNTGLAGMEIICRDMVAMGVYCARSLSNAGIVYDVMEHALTLRQLSQYDAVNRAWRTIVTESEAIVKDHDGRMRGAVRSALYSAMQRCYNAMLVSFKLPTVLEHARKMIDDGYAVIFQLTSTNEAVQERALGSRNLEDDLDELDLSPIETIRDFLERAFPTKVYVTRSDAEGHITTEVLTKDGVPVLDPALVEIRDQLVERIATLSCPDGPLEIINDTLGVDNVAEVTGRSRRPVRRMVNGHLTRIIETRGKGATLAEIHAFRDGKKFALVFSEAGGTGQSYHADRSYPNHRPRVHYLVQTGWKVKKAVQGLFRSHRTNQVCPPLMFLCTTNVPGEKRFIATIAREMDQLGAMTHGQRDAAGSKLFSAADNLETAFGDEALQGLLKAIQGNNVEGLSAAAFASQTGLQLFNKDGSDAIGKISMTRMLNRLLAMDIDEQGGTQAIFMENLLARMRQIIESAKINGTLDTGVQRIAPRSLQIREQDELHHAPSGAVTTLLSIDIEDYNVQHSFDVVRDRIREYRRYHAKDTVAGFYRDEESGELVAVIPALKSEVARGWRDSGLCFAYTPFTSREASVYQFTSSYGNTWKRLEAREAETPWRMLTQEAPLERKVMHGIIGAMLPVWNRLPTEMPIVYRATTDDGQALLLRLIPEDQLAGTLVKFGRSGGLLSPQEAIELVSSGTICEVNGWRIKRSTVNNAQRIEIVLDEHTDPYTVMDRFKAEGVLIERINFRMRFFLPHGSESDVLEGLVSDAPITRQKAA